MEIILAAVIAAIAPTATMLLKWRHDSRATAKREDWLEQNVGSANGQGNIVQMLERSLLWQGKHEAQDRRIAEYLGVPEVYFD